MSLDPIEKKPLYHFNPGSTILSLGFAGCNLHCPFCQNWHISQGTDAPGRYLSPAAIIAAAQSEASPQIAYTYSEPLVHIEYLLDCMALAHKAGIANVLVSNGCINPEAAEHILSLTDAANIDLKCFSEDTYTRILGGDLPTVGGFIKKAWEMGVHLEVTTLIVPGLNDSDAELDRCINFLAGISKDIPWHLSAYHPDYQWDAPPTDASRLISCVRRAREQLSHVYTGNIHVETNDTPCPHCGSLLVQRRGYRVNTTGLTLKREETTSRYYCSHCGKAIDSFKAAPGRTC
jgi:pyruvate formate lyase activating enzyme